MVEDFQKQYGYNQQLGIYEKDYIDGSGQSYEGIIFTDGVTEVVYYNQLDERWADLPYGTDNIGGYGCGPTSMAIVVSSLTDQTVDPPNNGRMGVSEWLLVFRQRFLSLVDTRGLRRAFGLRMGKHQHR